MNYFVLLRPDIKARLQHNKRGAYLLWPLTFVLKYLMLLTWASKGICRSLFWLWSSCKWHIGSSTFPPWRYLKQPCIYGFGPRRAYHDINKVLPPNIKVPSPDIVLTSQEHSRPIEPLIEGALRSSIMKFSRPYHHSTLFESEAQLMNSMKNFLWIQLW